VENNTDSIKSNAATQKLALVDIPDFVLEKLAGHTATLRLAKKGVLPNTHKFEDFLVIVKSGWVALNFNGKAVCLLRPGEVFLESAWPLQAVASQRNITLSAATSSELLLVERAAFFEAVAAHPNILFSLYAHACKRMLQMVTAVARKNTESVENRLAYFLWDVATPVDDGTRLLPKLSQAVISELLGERREEINRKRKALAERGLLLERADGDYLTAEVGVAVHSAGYGRD
jgi:CRP-like cAMP-binding protein